MTPLHTRGRDQLEPYPDDAVPRLRGRDRREQILEWYAAMMGAYKALSAATAGQDLCAMSRDLDTWDRLGSPTSDWPGWETLGLTKPEGWDRTPRKRTARTAPKEPKADPRFLIEGDIPPRGQWVVYRHYDAAGFLLYVGLTSNFAGRHAQHRAGAVWWGDIVRITTEQADGADDARARELVAIATEDPEWNQADRP